MRTFHSHSSTIDVLKFLIADLKSMMSESASLFKIEMQGKVKNARQAAIQVVIGGIMGYFGVWIFIGALILGLGVFVPLWISAGIVAMLFLGCAAYFLYQGIQILKNFEFTPKQTVQTLKEINHVFSRQF